MEEWIEYKLEEICTKITDGSHSSPKAQESGYPMFSVKDMLEYGFDYSKCKYISQEDYVILKHNGCVPQKGDVLVAKDGSYLKQIFVCKETKDEAILSSIAIFRPNSLADSYFLNYLLKSPQVYNYIANNCVSGSALPRIVLKDFKAVKLPIPSIGIQKSIVAVLKSLDDKIEVNRKTNENLEQQAQALFKSWFVDFEPFKNGEFVESELGMIPKGWRVERIEDLSQKMASGGTPKSLNKDYYLGNIKWYSTKELKDCFLFDSEKHISEDALKNSSAKMFPEGTVLMAIYASPTVGRLGILTNPATFNQAAVGIVPKENVGSEFIYLSLLSERTNLNNLASGAAQQNLNVGIVKNYNILVPEQKALDRFNRLAKSYFLLLKKNTEESRRLAELRDTLLPKLMSGELKVNEIEDVL